MLRVLRKGVCLAGSFSLCAAKLWRIDVISKHLLEREVPNYMALFLELPSMV
jgi:hypothetical protein